MSSPFSYERTRKVSKQVARKLELESDHTIVEGLSPDQLAEYVRTGTVKDI